MDYYYGLAVWRVFYLRNVKHLDSIQQN